MRRIVDHYYVVFPVKSSYNDVVQGIVSRQRFESNHERPPFFQVLLQIGLLAFEDEGAKAVALEVALYI